MNASTLTPEQDAESASSTHAQSSRVLEVELSQPLPDLSVTTNFNGQPYQRALCLVRLHAQPLGQLELRLNQGTLLASDMATSIWQTFGEQINAHLIQDGLKPVTSLAAQGLINEDTPYCVAQRERFLINAPFVSIIVATRERPQTLRCTLDSLLTQHYPRYEIIVVDNAPVTSATIDLITQHYQDQPSIHYVREDLPGLSYARNRGLQVARGELVAITDDDVVLDSLWLLEMIRDLLSSERVACVTGMVLPLEVETTAQVWFEQYGGYNKGFVRRVFNKYEHHPRKPLFPYASGQFGTGSNSAFRLSFLREVGGFDPVLGAGTAARGGEDLAIFFQVISQGYTLIYEPAAFLYHLNRRGYEDLRKLMYNYGVGLTAYLMKLIKDNPLVLLDMLIRSPYGLYLVLGSKSSKNQYKTVDYPKELSTLERRGMLYGPFAYFRSLWSKPAPSESKVRAKNR